MSEQTNLFGDGAAALPAPTAADPAVPTTMKRDAVLSPCGMYRYRLTRSWDETLPMLGWIMLNPSTADASVDDPTIRKCVGFARRGGFGSIVVTNLFAFRATDPKELKKRAPTARTRNAWKAERDRDVSEIVGPDNDRHIVEAGHEAKLTILAWGAHGDLGLRSAKVMWLLQDAGLFASRRTAVLARTEDGMPRHPLYLKYELIDPLVAELARDREVG